VWSVRGGIETGTQLVSRNWGIETGTQLVSRNWGGKRGHSAFLVHGGGKPGSDYGRRGLDAWRGEIGFGRGTPKTPRKTAKQSRMKGPFGKRLAPRPQVTCLAGFTDASDDTIFDADDTSITKHQCDARNPLTDFAPMRSLRPFAANRPKSHLAFGPTISARSAIWPPTTARLPQQPLPPPSSPRPPIAVSCP
jgi:hypothetical protein